MARFRRSTPVCERLRLLRVERGWTIEETADAIGVSAKSWWAWEHGASEPLRRNRGRVAAVFGLIVSDIWEG